MIKETDSFSYKDYGPRSPPVVLSLLCVVTQGSLTVTTRTRHWVQKTVYGPYIRLDPSP